MDDNFIQSISIHDSNGQTYLDFRNEYYRQLTDEIEFSLEPGVHSFFLKSTDSVRNVTEVEFSFHELVQSNFIRGDADQDGKITISDPIQIMDYLFIGNIKDIACLDAADANDDGIANISDAQYLLGYMFAGTNPEPKAPFNTCGVDPTPTDNLGCRSFPRCVQ